MNALIVGGGIGGLCAALALQARGWNITVLEQAAEISEVGAGLQLSPNACKVLDALGLMPALESCAFRPEALEMRLGRSGRQVFSIPLQTAALQRWGAPYLHLHRADLIRVLSEALQARAPLALRTGQRVTGYTQNPHGIQAKLKTGENVEADILIGADGLHSVIREQLLGPQSPRFTGNIAWRAVVPIEALGADAPPPTACVWTGRGRHAVTYRLRGGRLANFVGVVEQKGGLAESWTQQGTRQEALADFAGWHPTLIRLIEKAQVHYRWALFDRPPLPRWHDGRAMLLGDACHPMLPFLAQGAAMAIEDAWVLAQELSDTDTGLCTGAEKYFQRRQLRTAKVQAGARANMKLFHRSAPAYTPLWLAARFKPAIFHQRQDWLYGYDPLSRRVSSPVLETA